MYRRVLMGETGCAMFLIIGQKPDILFYSQVSQLKDYKVKKKQKKTKIAEKGKKSEIVAVAKLMHRCE